MKYMVEGNIDFFGELYNSISIEEKEEKEEDSPDFCLISNQPLVEPFVRLDCGHKFNYLPLYYDIYNSFNTFCLYCQTGFYFFKK